MTITASTLGGAVYDRGYRPYDGPRGGRADARWALWRLTVRRALGLRRSWRQKVLPWSLLGLVTVPAMVDIGIRYATRDTPVYEVDFEFLTFREYLGVSTLLMLFVAVSAPDVVCPDRHDRVLPLIFSRQLTGLDYVLAKVGGIFTIVFGFAFLPQMLLFLGQMCGSDTGALDYIGDNADVLWQVPIAVALLALYQAAISVALASLTDRRIVAGIALIGLMMVTTSVSAVFVHVAEPDGTILALLNLWTVPLVLRDLVFLGQVERFGPLDGVEGAAIAAVMVYVAMVAASFAVLLWRYREVNL
jgi:ABC-2 type transport system permease protein